MTNSHFVKKGRVLKLTHLGKVGGDTISTAEGVAILKDVAVS